MPIGNGQKYQLTIINHTEIIMLIDYKKVNIYQDERLILKDVDFQAETGEFIYLIGRVGSGKSSLLKTIYGELDIDSEDAEKAVVLDESMPNIKRSRIPALRKQMGIIFQDFQLLHDRSVAKNLKFVLQATGWTSKQKIERRIEEVLAQVGMTDKKNKMPSELSGGEQQRIAIARALLNTLRLLLPMSLRVILTLRRLRTSLAFSKTHAKQAQRLSCLPITSTSLTSSRVRFIAVMRANFTNSPTRKKFAN